MGHPSGTLEHWQLNQTITLSVVMATTLCTVEARKQYTFTAEDAAPLALKVQALQAKLMTHIIVIVIGVVPTSLSAST